MGGGGSSSTSSQYSTTYTTTGGGIDFTNLLGNFNYKSSGGISTTNTESFSQHLSSSQESTATSKGGSGGTFDVAASVGVGVGGGSGSGGTVDKVSSYTGDSDTFGSTGGSTSGSGISTTTMLIGGGIAVGLAFILARRKK